MWKHLKGILFGAKLSAMIGMRNIVGLIIKIGMQLINSILKEFTDKE